MPGFAQSLTALVAMLCVLSCGPRGSMHGPVKIDAGDKGAHIAGALEFIHEREPAIHALVIRHVSEIRWKGDPFWSNTRFPGHITLSTAAISRGRIYLASLLYHELNHIMLYKLRNRERWMDDVSAIERHYRAKVKLDPGILARLSRFDEEKLVHELQLRFLVKHGDEENARLQKLNIIQLDKTYRHLPR